MTTSALGFPLIKGRIEAGPLNFWVCRHEDKTKTLPGQPHSWKVNQGIMGFLRSSWHFLLSESMEKMTLRECKGSSSCWSTVSQWSLGKCGRTQSRAFPSTIPNATLKLLDRITRGNGHKCALFLLVLCQSWLTIFWTQTQQQQQQPLTEAVWSWSTDCSTWAALAHSELQHVCHLYAQGTSQLNLSCAVIMQVSQFPSYSVLVAPQLHYKLQQWAKVTNSS